MRKANYLWYTIMIILIPLMIVILSSNIMLRTKETYVFHFNDSQVVDKLYTSIKENEFASEIASYWSSFNESEFQIYEENGDFKDPIFKESETLAMSKLKKVINIEFAVGVAFLVISLILYRYLYVRGFHEALHRLGYITAGITAFLLILMNLLVRMAAFRRLLYSVFVGIDLGKKSALITLLGSPFYKTYLVFATIAAVALLAVLFYVNYNLTKDKRIFY